MPSADLGAGLRRRAAASGAVLALGVAVALPSPAAELAPRAQVDAIVQALRADPDLQATRKARVLQFKEHEEKRPEPKEPAPWLLRWVRWLGQAFEWLADTTRWLVWLLGALAVAMLVVSVRRWSRERADGVAGLSEALPSHVGSLDVRPDSLPDRIGAHAQALWQRGEQRAALSLLYRGALSRLIHVHSVPIRAAHTEPECVRLAQGRLSQGAGNYFARLVAIWQLAVYAGRAPDGAGVLALCDQFDAMLGRAAAPAAAPGTAA